MAMITLGAPSSAANPPRLSQDHLRSLVKLSGVALGALAVCSVAIGIHRLPSHAPVPYNPAMKAFRAAIWTASLICSLHPRFAHRVVDRSTSGSIGKSNRKNSRAVLTFHRSGMWESQRRMRKIIEELQLDIVGLLESDLQRIVLGNRDLCVRLVTGVVSLTMAFRTQYMSEELGMYVDLGPGPQKHTWGAALLSKFPIVNSTHHLLPSPKGELAPGRWHKAPVTAPLLRCLTAIHATLDIYGTLVDVIVSHNGQEEDPVESVCSLLGRRRKCSHLGSQPAASVSGARSDHARGISASLYLPWLRRHQTSCGSASALQIPRRGRQDAGHRTCRQRPMVRSVQALSTPSADGSTGASTSSFVVCGGQPMLASTEGETSPLDDRVDC